MSTTPIRNLIKRLLPPRLVHAIQQRRLRQNIAAYTPRVVQHRYGDHEFSVHLGDGLAQGWYDHDWAEPPEITLLKRWSLQPGALVFDLGAHQGVVAMILAAECQPGGRVVSVEGSLHNVLAARRNAELNSLAGRITTLHAVAGERHGSEICFSSTLNGQVKQDGAGERVSCVSIDGLVGEHGMPRLVFVDVEGYECQVLKGAGNALAAGVDFFVEVHVGAGLEENGSVEELLGFFPEPNYLLHIAAGEGMPFIPWIRGDALPAHKFFLAARARSI